MQPLALGSNLYVAKDIAKLTTAIIDLKDHQIKVECVNMKVAGDSRPWTLSQGKRPTPVAETGGKVPHSKASLSLTAFSMVMAKPLFADSMTNARLQRWNDVEASSIGGHVGRIAEASFVIPWALFQAIGQRRFALTYALMGIHTNSSDLPFKSCESDWNVPSANKCEAAQKHFDG